MDILQPVYTETAECQDCYKCLRECAVKAICVQDGHARVIPEACLQCGHCVTICPVKAKRIRGDLERVRLLLKLRKQIYVSLAPSYLAEFPEYTDKQIIAGLKALGFAGVSQTALGAQEVSASAVELFSRENGFHISSACPVITDLIHKYYPEYSRNITNLYSPMLAHSKILRDHYGSEIGVVFIGPCVAKKNESDRHKDMLDVALTFESLRKWWHAEGINPAELELTSEDEFVPKSAEEGTLYPVDGGMIAGMKSECSVNNTEYMTFSGLKAVSQALEGLSDQVFDHPVFIEMLACEGGCVNGPGMTNRNGTVTKRCRIIENSKYDSQAIPRKPLLDLNCTWNVTPVIEKNFSEEEIRKALELVGKRHKQDELNCGGCGYDSCREFARALLVGRAEKDMCVGYMRKLAHKKVDALISSMPSGVVMVDRNMTVVESNKKFAELLGEDALQIFEACPGLTGASLAKIVPFADLFRNVLDKGLEKFQKNIRYEERILDLTIFTVETKMLVGAVLKDVTEPVVQKEHIVEKAQEVIDKNLETVQKIAFLLGENAAESEVILSSIKNMFK